MTNQQRLRLGERAARLVDDGLRVVRLGERVAQAPVARDVGGTGREDDRLVPLRPLPPDDGLVPECGRQSGDVVQPGRETRGVVERGERAVAVAGTEVRHAVGDPLGDGRARPVGSRRIVGG